MQEFGGRVDNTVNSFHYVLIADSGVMYKLKPKSLIIPEHLIKGSVS